MAVHDEGSRARTCRVSLLSSFACDVGGFEVVLPEAPRRLVISLALSERRVARGVLVERLWPDSEPERAAKRLRQTLWRLRRLTGDRVVRADQDSVELARDTVTDLGAAGQLARFAVSTEATSERLAAIPVDRWRPLGLALLPDECPVDEIYQAQQQWDRLRLLALEKVADALLTEGDVTGAILVASLAAVVDDLRERPRLLLARAHLARSELAAAHRIYADYSTVLRDGLGVDPSPEFDLVFRQPR